MKNRKEVVQWLKDNELYDKVKRKLPFAVEKFPTMDTDLHQFFVLAFDWRYTSEGEDYWKDVNRQYQEWFGKTSDDSKVIKRKKKK